MSVVEGVSLVARLLSTASDGSGVGGFSCAGPAQTGWQQLIGGIPIVVGWWVLGPVSDFSTIGWPALAFVVSSLFLLAQKGPAAGRVESEPNRP